MVELGTVLEAAHELVMWIRSHGGAPPPGHKGGRRFRNEDGRLPPGEYREYDLPPGRPRRAERVVIEQNSGRAYLSPDHYNSFVSVEDPPQ
jgi:ribonuclease T1